MHCTSGYVDTVSNAINEYIRNIIISVFALYPNIFCISANLLISMRCTKVITIIF